MHKLWTLIEEHGYGQLERASDEELVAALLDSPAFPDPFVMGFLKRNKPQVIVTYQQLFCGGNVPQSIRKFRQQRIGM